MQVGLDDAGKVDKVLVDQDTDTLGNISAVDAAIDSWSGIVSEEMRCREVTDLFSQSMYRQDFDFASPRT